MNHRTAVMAWVVGGLLGSGTNVARAADGEGPATSDQNFDAQGNIVRVGPVQERAAPTLAASALACLELHRSDGTWAIQVSFNPNTYPFTITGGSITGTICGSPNWTVTGGTLGSSLTLNATYTGAGSCAQSATIVGNFASPAAYSGTYGFNGNSSLIEHKILFKGWGPC